MPEISVIVPVYKTQKYLKRCIESILSQNFTDFELIIVDDGSPDDCGKICDGYAVSDSRVFVLHQENRGVSAARNAGLRASHGSYIAFIDSDDYVAIEYLSELYAMVKRHKAEISIVGAFPFDNDSDRSIDAVTIYHSGRSAVQEIGIQHTYRFRCCWGKLIKRQIAEAYLFPENQRIGEDFAIVYKWLFTAKLVTAKDTPLYFYNKANDESATHHFQLKSLDELRVNEMLTFFKINDFPDNLKLYAEEYVMRSALYTDRITKEYPHEKKLLQRLRRDLRKAIKEYGSLIGLNQSSQKNFIIRTANPTAYKIKRTLKKIRNKLKLNKG